jgi:acyl-CoA oxidase
VQVVELGWAHIERLSLQIFQTEVARAPSALQPSLAALCWLYGATRLERSLTRLLGAGVLAGSDVAALRAAVNEACHVLGGAGAGPALKLCEGFGIPDHLLQAPIAFNWRDMC